MLAVLQEAITIVNTASPDQIDLAHLPPDDPVVYHMVTVAPKAWHRRRYGRLPPLVIGAITSAGPARAEMTDIGGRMISGGRVAELELCDYTYGHSDEEI